MTEMRVEIEGSIDEVVLVLHQLGSAGHRVTARDAGRSGGTPADGNCPASTIFADSCCLIEKCYRKIRT